MAESIFARPSAAQRLTAVGQTNGLPDKLRRALDPQVFEPIPLPEPGDWLATHTESAQGFEQFINEQPNRPDRKRNKLYLQPIGDFRETDAPAVDELLQFAVAFFTLETSALPPLDMRSRSIASRRHATGQTQLLTTDLLKLLRAELPSDAFALIGITMIDLYPDPSWNFVFGQASLRERVGVYSFARYDPRFYGEPPRRDSHGVLLFRSCKVLAHETCHMFGIKHCIWYRCLMNGSNHLAESDARPLHLCPVDLRKLQWSVGFDVLGRYRRLNEFVTRADFSEETHWLRRQIRFIDLGFAVDAPHC